MNFLRKFDVMTNFLAYFWRRYELFDEMTYLRILSMTSIGVSVCVCAHVCV